MKTKIIPFDLEIVKKIQAGEIKGKVYFKTKLPDGSETHTFNLKAIHCINNIKIPYYGLFECDGEECIQCIKPSGYVPDQLVTLTIEVPDNEPQFKPFDKVLVRHSDKSEWRPRLYSRKGNVGYCMQDGFGYEQCIPYAGNEHLVGTTEKPKEE